MEDSTKVAESEVVAGGTGDIEKMAKRIRGRPKSKSRKVKARTVKAQTVTPEPPSMDSPADAPPPAIAKAREHNDSLGIQFFGEIDLNVKGLPTSEYPGWYNPVHREELAQEIDRQEHQLKMGLIPPDAVPTTRASLQKNRERLGAIDASFPKLADNDKDKVARTVEELGAQIRDAHFSRSDMMRGTADAHEEARRMSEPIIKLRGHELDLARACKIPVTRDGKVTRDQAEKAWKIARRVLGESTDVEHLRRD